MRCAAYKVDKPCEFCGKNKIEYELTEHGRSDYICLDCLLKGEESELKALQEWVDELRELKRQRNESI
jgi:hypothetical protein